MGMEMGVKMNEVKVFENNVYGNLEWYEEDGTIYLSLEQCARGLGFVQIKNGVQYIRWETVKSYLDDLGFSQEAGNYPNKMGKGCFIPENIFYRLAMKARNETAERFQAWIADEVVPSIRKTGSYHSKPMTQSPMTQAELALWSAQQLVEQERRMAALEDHYREVDCRLDELDARTTTRPQVYYTVAGYWKQMGKPLTRQEAASLGKKATLICKALGAVKRTVDDERFGEVGSYPVNVLKMVYESEMKNI